MVYTVPTELWVQTWAQQQTQMPLDTSQLVLTHLFPPPESTSNPDMHTLTPEVSHPSSPAQLSLLIVLEDTAASMGLQDLIPQNGGEDQGSQNQVLWAPDLAFHLLVV